MFLQSLIKDPVTYTEHGQSKTVTVLDVVFLAAATRRAYLSAYGYDDGNFPASACAQLKPTSKSAIPDTAVC